MIFRLDERLIFPDPKFADDDGLLAVGGDLSFQRLLLAYQNGIFPWYNEQTPILWYSPHERFVLFPAEMKIAKSLRQVLNSGAFKVTVNTDFAGVIKGCAETGRPGQEGTWITTEMKAAYMDLHQRGFAMSVEVWRGDELAGGLYGVVVNNVFCGESMFSRVSNASKVALVHLCGLQYKLIDCQVYTAHLERLGARMISRREYMDIMSGNPEWGAI